MPEFGDLYVNTNYPDDTNIWIVLDEDNLMCFRTNNSWQLGTVVSVHGGVAKYVKGMMLPWTPEMEEEWTS